MSTPDGHELLVHPPGHHDADLDSGVTCMFCEGGLSACTRCGAFEGAWPDECPGEPMTDQRSDAVYAGTLNYRDGAWRDECCRVRRPAEDVLREQGWTRDDNGKWVKP
jgi:hypothetical protein